MDSSGTWLTLQQVASIATCGASPGGSGDGEPPLASAENIAEPDNQQEEQEEEGEPQVEEEEEEGRLGRADLFFLGASRPKEMGYADLKAADP
eukprot:6352539-Amphidinium_carterae.3